MKVTLPSVPSCQHRHRGERGFTMIELLVTLTVVAVLLTMGIPSFGRLIASTRLSNGANELVGGLNLSRSEAIRRGQKVSLRATSNNENFHSGWEVISDADGSGAGATPVTTADGTVVRVGPAQGGATRMVRVTRTVAAGVTSYAVDSSGSGRGFVVFSGRGTVDAGAAFFRVCDENNTAVPGRLIQVSLMGKVSVDSKSIVCP